MQFADFSPPSLPTPDQQADALRKGLGRSMLWAKAGKLDEGQLLAACLEDRRHDMQIEDDRWTWLWALIQAVDAAERFRKSIFNALMTLPDAESAYQICGLAGYYAARGDKDFRERIRELVKLKPLDECRCLGETELLQFDGEAGFLLATSVRGTRLTERDWDWDDSSLLREAIDLFGKPRVIALLEQASEPAIQHFRDLWQKDEEAPEPESSLDRDQAMSVKEILTLARTSSENFSRFQQWGKHASEADRERVYQALVEADSDDVSFTSELLWVFLRRPFPRFDTRLLELCRHPDFKLRHRAFVTLGKLHHPEVRAFAVREITSGHGDRRNVGLLIKNYQPGDEKLILDHVNLPEDVDELHGLLMDTIKLLEENVEADISQLALICYIHNPCESCRADAVKLLQQEGLAPCWLIEEAVHDSDKRTRNRFTAESTS